MATGFGSASHTDHFGFATANLIMLSSTEVPDANARAEAEDEWGDIVEATAHGNTAGAIKSATVVYGIKGAECNLSTAFTLGEITVSAAKVVVESIRAETNNKDPMPKVTVTGKLGTEDMVGDVLHSFKPSAIVIQNRKQAQLLGYTLTSGNLVGSTYEATVALAQAEDGDGEPAAHGISGGIEQVTLDLSRDTNDEFAVGVPGTWKEEQKPGMGDSPQADYSTGTASAWKVLVRETA